MEYEWKHWIVRYKFANSDVVHDTIGIGSLEDAIDHAKFLRQNGEIVLGVIKVEHLLTNELVILE